MAAAATAAAAVTMMIAKADPRLFNQQRSAQSALLLLWKGTAVTIHKLAQMPTPHSTQPRHQCETPQMQAIQDGQALVTLNSMPQSAAHITKAMRMSLCLTSLTMVPCTSQVTATASSLLPPSTARAAPQRPTKRATRAWKRKN